MWELNRIVDLSDVHSWQAVNDGVMGGISAGHMVTTESGLRFEGALSLENDGGFASVRRPVADDPGDAHGVRLVLRGDGRRYQFRLRPDDRPDSIAWRVRFEAGPEWRMLEFEWADFEPVFRGRLVPQRGPVAPADIRWIGFMLADGKAGPFGLDIRSIAFF